MEIQTYTHVPLETTGNKTYQDWGWEIFKAFEANYFVEFGYVGLRDVSTCLLLFIVY